MGLGNIIEQHFAETSVRVRWEGEEKPDFTVCEITIM